MPFVSFFCDRVVVKFNKNDTLKRGRIKTYSKIIYQNDDEVIFAISEPKQEKALLLSINCDKSEYHVLEVLERTGHRRFEPKDSFWQFDSFGIGIRYFRILFSKPISKFTMPIAMGTKLCNLVGT